jgi:hypothetical protein
MSTPATLSEAFSLLSRTRLTDDADLQAGLRRVATAGCSLLTNCAAASITIIEHGRHSTVAATSDTAVVLDEIQYAQDDGPCLTAARERRTIRIQDLSVDERWPAFSRVAQRNGFRSVLSVAMDLGDRGYAGGLNIYAGIADGFTDQDEQVADAFAAQAAVTVANAHAYWATFELTRHLTTAMASRAVIEQAKGILMAPAGWPPTRPSTSSVTGPRQRTASSATSPPTSSRIPARTETVNSPMTLDAARQQLDLTVMDLWIAYFALGGLADAPTLNSYLHGDAVVSDPEHNLIAHALNEAFSDRLQNSPVPYREHR